MRQPGDAKFALGKFGIVKRRNHGTNGVKAHISTVVAVKDGRKRDTEKAKYTTPSGKEDGKNMIRGSRAAVFPSSQIFTKARVLAAPSGWPKVGWACRKQVPSKELFS